MKRSLPPLILLLFLSLQRPVHAQSQAEGTGESEASPSLFSAEIGGEEAELFLRGSWSFELLSSMGVGTGPSGLALASSTPILFTQRPDFVLSLLLFKRWYLETTVGADLSKNLYAAGYRGLEGEALREVRIGNSGIAFPSFPYLSLGTGALRSFGAAAYLEWEGFKGTAILRYDQAQRKEKRFFGMYELAETEIDPAYYVADRWFLLPDTGVESLVVYEESLEGLAGSDGLAYRALAAEEFSLENAVGRLSLAVAARGRILVAYTKGGSVPYTGEIDVEGSSCVLLYDPDSPSERGFYPRYAFPREYGESSARFFVRDLATGLEDTLFSVALDSGYLEVSPVGASDLRSEALARPFHVTMPWIYEKDYGNPSGDPERYPSLARKSLVVQSFAPAESIVLESGILPGSIEVTRNGEPEQGFAFDPLTATVTLAYPPGPSDLIVFSYLLSSSQAGTGSVVAGASLEYEPDEARYGYAAVGLRWSLPGSGYSLSPEDSPGILTITAGGRAGKEGLLARAALSAGYSRSDASGYLRVEGMESSGAFGTSFRPVEGEPVSPIVESADARLALDLPAIHARVHPSGEVQESLALPADAGGGSIVLEKALDELSLDAYAAFQFLARAEGIDEATVLAIELVGEEGVLLGATLPASALGSAWRAFRLRYDGSLPEILVSDTGEEPFSFVTGGGASFLPGGGARLLRIRALGHASGTIYVDELAFVEPRDGFSSSFFLTGSAASSGPLLVVAGYPLLGMAKAESGLRLGASLSDGSGELYGSGEGRVEASLGPLGIKANALGSVDGDAFSWELGHELALPLAEGGPFRIAESFTMDSGASRYGKTLGLALTWPGAASISGKARSVFDGSALEQQWGAEARAGSFLALKAGAFNRGPSSSSLLPGDYAGSWLDSFALLLPSGEAVAERRSLEASLVFSPWDSKEIFKFTAGADRGSLIAGSAEEELSLELALPLGQEAFLVSPYYKRVMERSYASASGAILDDAVETFESLVSFSPWYAEAPVAELFDSGLASRFATASEGPGSLAYEPEMGISWKRGVAGGWIDALLPMEGRLALRRELLREGEYLLPARAVDVEARSAAFNLFGASGAYPLTGLFKTDEYASNATLVLRSYDESPTIGYEILGGLVAGFYGEAGDEVSTEARASLSGGAAGPAGSALARLERRYRPAGSILGGLMDSLVSWAMARSGGDPGTGTKAKARSAFLERLAASQRSLSESFGIEYDFTRDLDGKVDHGLEEWFETKTVFASLLTAWARAALTETFSYASASSWSFILGYELTLGLKASF